ncbi:MAG: transglycosylase SLT domain-containing protein, partial [Gammaproteobacteria bacterium]|nr:transglycosylase SLT domain-containing protein [Gammaproteobacteria bacterium]
SQYADYLLKNHSEEIIDGSLKYLVVHIPLVENKLPHHVEKYQSWVADYAQKYGVSEDLIFAIMEVESGFNSKAVSKSNALGLMQLKAESAGRDVYELIDGKDGQPNRAELFDAQNNIRMGTAYLSLLKREYLQGVRNAKNKEMISISSYNGGITKTLKLFGKTPDVAILRVNQLHPKQVYRTLRYQHQSNETRLYLDKVLKAKSRYRDLLGLNV